MKWHDVIEQARQLRALLQPSCERVEIAGSLRRLRPMVRDIELVAKPRIDPFDRLQMRVAEMISQGTLEHGPKSQDGKKAPAGPRYYRLRLPEVDLQLDLFAVLPPADFGVIYTIRTGSAEFSHWLVTEALRKGFQVQEGQLWKWSVTDQAERIQERVRVPCGEEEDLFRALGIEYIHASDRETPPLATKPASVSTGCIDPSVLRAREREKVTCRDA